MATKKVMSKSKTKGKKILTMRGRVVKEEKRIIVTSIAIGAVGILGYFGWQYLQKRNAAKKGNTADSILAPMNNNFIAADDTNNYPSEPIVPTPKKSTSSILKKSVFPLKKGSKGAEVKALQEAIIAKYGKSYLPKYGADGDFGSETVNALKKMGMTATVNESAFLVLTEVNVSSGNDVGTNLFKAAAAKNYNNIIALLKKINTVDDYSTANESFKSERLNGVHQTIVNGLLSTFTAVKQKEAIKLEFLRMGLQFNGKQWSLSGFDGKTIVTNQMTTVWISAKNGVSVPSRMVLGCEVSRRLDYTLFENNGKYFLVNTQSVQYL